MIDEFDNLQKKYSNFSCFRKVFKIKLFIVICLIICLGFTVYMVHQWQWYRVSVQNHVVLPRHRVSLPHSNGVIHNCYTRNYDHGNSHNMLKDILCDDVVKPIPGKSIFFHETSCSKTGIVKLKPRQACAIESAALMNPDWKVFTLFASPVGINNVTKDPIIEALLSYENINLRNVDLWIYAENTPLEKWIYNGKLLKSKYLFSHTSDYLRYVSMYKYGGVYLDLDVVVMESFNHLEPNYAGSEAWNSVAAGILSFEPDKFGHYVADMCLRDLNVNFNGSSWGTNGPGCITRVLRKLCGTIRVDEMTRENCHGFLVHPKKEFYAIGYDIWPYFFDESYVDKALQILENSTIAHVWNKLSSRKKIEVGSDTAYGYLAERYCPKVYWSCGEYF